MGATGNGRKVVCVCVCCVGETEGCVQDLGREVCLCGHWWRNGKDVQVPLLETLNLQEAVSRQLF